MTLSSLTPQDASAIAVSTLGMDADSIGLTSPEGLGGLAAPSCIVHVSDEPEPSDRRGSRGTCGRWLGGAN